MSSLFGFLPLGVWTVNHLWDNLAAFRGADAWQKAATEYDSPIAHVLTLVVVLVPLLAHTVWGMGRVFSSRPNLRTYSYFENVKYFFQRFTAVGLVFFLGAHLWLALIRPRIVYGHAEKFSDLAAHTRHHAPTTLVYLLGVLGIAYHLANGLSSFAFRFGLIAGRQAERRFNIVVYSAFALLLVMGLGAIYGLWEAGAAFPPPAE